VSPEAHDGAEAKRIGEQYGFAPMAAGLLDPQQFYFYVVLGQGEQLMQIDLGDYTDGILRDSISAGLKRFAKGFTRTVALVTPKPSVPPQMAMQMGQPPENLPRFDALHQMLGQDYNVIDEDLSDGQVNPSADILILAAPKLNDDKARFALDQFVMRGGTVLLASAPNATTVACKNGLHIWGWR